jgi:hypothetical protein
MGGEGMRRGRMGILTLTSTPNNRFDRRPLSEFLIVSRWPFAAPLDVIVIRTT